MFFEVWLPALTAWEESNTIDLITPLASVRREADLRETRATRRLYWAARLREPQAH
jgi:hypothetical protein